MPNEIKTKKSFGSTDISHFSPPLNEGAAVPKAINIVISFEEALKLHLSLGQALAKLNGYHRGTTEGKCAAVNLCVYRDQKRIAVVEDKLPRAGLLGNARATAETERQQD